MREREVNVGIAIKPNTSVEEIIPYLDDIDLVLVMLVEPGFGGQTMIEECLEKVKKIRRMRPNIDIEVDGGVNLENSKALIDAGASILVSGSTIFNSADIAKTVKALKKSK